MTLLLNWLKKLKNSTKSAKSPISDGAQEKEVNNDSLTIEREVIKNTPFTMVGTPKHGYWLTMGKHRISQAYKTKKEVIKYLKRSDWTLVTSVMIAFIHDRDLIDKAYTKDLNVHPHEKSRQTSLNLNQH